MPETVDHLIVPVRTSFTHAPWGDTFVMDDLTDGVHSKDDHFLKLSREKATIETKSQIIKRFKLETVKKIVDTFNMSTCMIFCRTNLDCDHLEQYFIRLSGGGKHMGKRESGKENLYSCVVVAGKRQQRERRENLEAFRDGDVRFLICTDVAARGIDLSELPFVIQMTLPDDPDQYYHRIGRVGRAGRMGLAIAIVADQDNEKVWYHANCKKKGAPCNQTKLVKQRGCCIYFNEPSCLRGIEKKLGDSIRRIEGADLILPEGIRIEDYGEIASKKKKQTTSARVKSLQPAVEELTLMEVDVQTLWLQSKEKYGKMNAKKK